MLRDRRRWWWRLFGTNAATLPLCVLLGLVLGPLWWFWRRRNESAEYERRCVQAEAEADRLRVRIESLKTEVASLRSGLPQARSVPAPSEAGHGDDLKRIRGIGPVMEQTLHSFGIHTWEQIAALTADDVVKLTEAIGAFPGRIARDDWIGGAQRLLDQRHADGYDR